MIDWFEKISRNRWNYYFSFIADTALGLAFVAHALYLTSAAGWSIPWYLPFLAFFAGNFVQSFWEYFFHRWVFHDLFQDNAEGHQRHHDHPRGLLALPWFIDSLVISSFWVLFYLITGNAVIAGFATGGVVYRYVYYGLIHHSFHHFDFRNRYWRRLRAYHHIHHRLPDRNFGVSGSFWDLLLGTHYRARRYSKAA